MQNAITLKELRQNMEKYVDRVRHGHSLLVTKHSKPIFRLAPVDEGNWEILVDFTKIKRGGLPIEELLARL